MHWHEIAAAKRQSILDAIPPEWRLNESQMPPPHILRDVTGFIRAQLSPLELDITEQPAPRLLARIRSRDYTAVEVTRAFCHRAALAHQLTHCLSHPLFAPALHRAAELDAHLATTSSPVGPLHGLPITLKDRFHLSATPAACGYVAWLTSPPTSSITTTTRPNPPSSTTTTPLSTPTDEGPLVRALLRDGAVVLAKTAVPTSMLMGETTNNITGSTLCAHNRLLNAGGASGGEGVVAACRGSAVGWGSDIAGSVRIPSGFNGVFGLRTGAGRVPAGGVRGSLPGLPVAGSVVGPVCGELGGLVEVMRWVLRDGVVAGAWRECVEVVEMPWREDVWEAARARVAEEGRRDGTLVFGVLRCDGEVRPHPPVRRAVEMCVRALKARGYEVIEWDPPPHAPAASLLFQIFGATAGQAVRDAIDASGEPPIPQLRDWYFGDSDPVNPVEPASATEFWRLCELRDEYRAKYHKYWSETRWKTKCGREVDGVIIPVAPSAGVEDGGFKYYAYSAIPSMLDYTAGAFPVTFADRDIDLEDDESSFIPLSQADRVNWQAYNKDIFHGTPVGLQVMGRRLQEEKVLVMMEAIAKALESVDV